MPKAIYSEQLLMDIRNGSWREPELDLLDQKLDAIVAQKLANALAQNTTLTSLNLKDNNIGVESAKALAQNTTLMSLDLNGNNIGAEVAKALAQNTTITSLKLADNKIGAEGAKALAQNTTLTSLDLGFNFIGDMEEKAISEMLLRNKKFRQASLTIAINQLISVPDLIPTILEYSADYTAEKARQHKGKVAQGDKQVDEVSTHSQAITTDAPTGDATATSATGFFSGNFNVNASDTNSNPQTVRSASHEARSFFKAKRKTTMNNDAQHAQANSGQGASAAAAAGCAKPKMGECVSKDILNF